MNLQPKLEARATAHRIDLLRAGGREIRLSQNAAPDSRPFVHPILAPDGQGVLTEDAPPHHPWQHGLYVGLNGVNGVGFWTEGLQPGRAARDGTFHPFPLAAPFVEGNRARWRVETEWRALDGSPLLHETQAWRFADFGWSYHLDLEWTLRAKTDLRFERYDYGGLFLRMPYREEAGGRAVSSEGLENGDAEGKRARWVAVTMVVPGRRTPAGIAVMDHRENPEHPVPWRVDGQLGVGPGRCIAGEWRLAEGEATTSRYRLFVFCGETNPDEAEASWSDFNAI